MLKLPLQLVRSTEWLHTSNDALVCYLAMRAEAQSGETATAKIAKVDLKLISGEPLDKLAEKVGMPQPTIARVQTELVKRGWIQKSPSGFLLGEIKDNELVWLADNVGSDEQEDTRSPADIMLAKVQEDRARMLAKSPVVDKSRADVEQKFASLAMSDFRPKETRAKDIILLFKSLYRKKYGEDAPLVSEGASNPHAVTHVYVSRAVKWANGSGDKTAKAIEFMFTNWDTIKDAMRLDGRESFHLVGSSKIWPRILLYVEEGLPAPRARADSVTNRAAEVEEPASVGW